MSDTAHQRRLPPERATNTSRRRRPKQRRLRVPRISIRIRPIVGSFVDLGIIIRRLLAAQAIAAPRPREGLLPQHRGAIIEEARFLRRSLSADLLTPHVVVAALLGEELLVGPALVHRSFV